MKKDIPEIGDLTQGINETHIILTHKLPEMLEKSSGLQDRTNGTSEKKTETDGEPIHLSPSKEVEDYWTGFLKNLEISDESNVKSERLVCRLDRDLADSLDDCNIHNRSRSDMVNAIVRTFFDIYLLQLVPFRREKKSLFTNFNQKDYEKETKKDKPQESSSLDKEFDLSDITTNPKDLTEEEIIAAAEAAAFAGKE